MRPPITSVSVIHDCQTPKVRPTLVQSTSALCERAVSSACRNHPRVRARSQFSLPQSPSGARAQSVQSAAIALGCARAVSSACRNRPRVRARSQFSLPQSPSGARAQSAQFAAITLGCARAVSSVCRNRPRVRARSQLSLPKSPSAARTLTRSQFSLPQPPFGARAQSERMREQCEWTLRELQREHVRETERSDSYRGAGASDAKTCSASGLYAGSTSWTRLSIVW